MKRFIALLLCAALLSLTACTGDTQTGASAAESGKNTENASLVSDASDDPSDASAPDGSDASDPKKQAIKPTDGNSQKSADANKPNKDKDRDDDHNEKNNNNSGNRRPYVTTATEEPTTVPATAAPTTAAPTTKATTAAPAPENSRSVTSKGYEIVTRGGITYILDGAAEVLVANKTYSLPADYYPGDLTPDCDAAYMKMKAAAAAEGLSLYISSGFRSYDTQDIIYNRYVANDGRANADTYSARPGHSEHQTGLAIDLNGVLDSFGNTAEGKWVAAHAHEYGFILRYPQGKEAQTGYMYEPWHIRYVGKDVAKKIYESGLCLEEYYGITSAYA